MPQSDKAEMSDQVTKPVMRAFRADLLAGGALRGFAFGAAVAACGFYDHSFWRSEIMMLVAAMFAMAGSAFPAPKKADDDTLTEK